MLASGPAWADVPRALGAYVRARAADAAGQGDVAVAGYRIALADAPDNTAVALRAYREGVRAGDMVLARSAATGLLVSGAAPPDATVFVIADAVRTQRWAAAEESAARLSGGPLDFLVAPIRAWIAYGRGDRTPEALLDVEAKNPLARRFNRENRALLLIASGRSDDGLATLRPLLADSEDSVNLRVAAAQLLARRGEGRAARDLLAGDDAVLTAVRSRVGRGVAPSAAFGLSRLFVRLAGDIVDGDARPLAIALCRSALVADPDDERARLTLAGALSNDSANTEALAVLSDIRAKSPYASAAAAMRITILSRAGDAPAALAAATAASGARGASADDAQRLGDLLMGEGRFADAAGAYATAIDRRGAADWTLLLQQGGALEQAGRWAEAKPLLERAVALAPDQAHALNYLGYAQIERGENMEAARALLERASALQPDDAAITDSLGWAWVKTGQPARALPLLERAAGAEPADSTINEHLGDAYWMVGRRYEARYAWRAAALYAEEGDAARIAGKIADGLTA